ncbi:MAG: hypothetical protein M0Z55_01885 [Peptococcaceae bacterium]|nr:hypothetical protein [Peptococcaceae bacterium]
MMEVKAKANKATRWYLLGSVIIIGIVAFAFHSTTSAAYMSTDGQSVNAMLLQLRSKGNVAQSELPNGYIAVLQSPTLGTYFALKGQSVEKISAAIVQLPLNSDQAQSDMYLFIDGIVGKSSAKEAENAIKSEINDASATGSKTAAYFGNKKAAIGISNKILTINITKN